MASSNVMFAPLVSAKRVLSALCPRKHTAIDQLSKDCTDPSISKWTVAFWTAHARQLLWPHSIVEAFGTVAAVSALLAAVAISLAWLMLMLCGLMACVLSVLAACALGAAVGGAALFLAGSTVAVAAGGVAATAAGGTMWLALINWLLDVLHIREAAAAVWAWVTRTPAHGSTHGIELQMHGLDDVRASTPPDVSPSGLPRNLQAVHTCLVPAEVTPRLMESPGCSHGGRAGPGPGCAADCDVDDGSGETRSQPSISLASTSVMSADSSFDVRRATGVDSQLHSMASTPRLPETSLSTAVVPSSSPPSLLGSSTAADTTSQSPASCSLDASASHADKSDGTDLQSARSAPTLRARGRSGGSARKDSRTSQTLRFDASESVLEFMDRKFSGS